MEMLEERDKRTEEMLQISNNEWELSKSNERQKTQHRKRSENTKQV